MGRSVIYLVKGIVFATVVMAAFIFALAGIMFKFEVSEQVMNVLVTGAYTISVFVGGLYFAKHGEKRRFLWGILFGSFFYVVYIITAACMGVIGDMGMMKAGLMLGLSAFGGMIGGMSCR